MLHSNPIEELVGVLRSLLSSLNFRDDPSEESNILFSMLGNALEHDLFEEFLESISDDGTSLEDVLHSVIVDHGQELLEATVHAWLSLGNPVQGFLQAIEAVQSDALDAVVTAMVSLIARNMTSAEITEARKIYGDTFDYATVYFSQETLSNNIIFGVQDYFNSNPNSRAFVLMKLVNFDVDDTPLGSLDYPTMIHELCHVWQFQNVGPVYAIQALRAQFLGDGYDYGTATGTTVDRNNGNGAETYLTNLRASNPTLTEKELFEQKFNREQQAQLIMHYYVRRYALSPPASYVEWQPFQNVVYTP